MTCTVIEWLPVFTRPETVNILLDCWQYQRQNRGLKLYGYVVLENHLHFIAQAPDLNGASVVLNRTLLDKSSTIWKHGTLSIY
jgi:REP element-mobilizing transposase RayT